MNAHRVCGVVVFSLLALSTAAYAGAGSPSPTNTRDDLSAALHGEAFAFLKYSLYAEQARQDGHPEVAAAFEAAANQERTEHFAELAKLFGLVGSTATDLAEAVAGETQEATVLYPQFAATAEAEGAKDVAALFRELANDEQAHANEFSTLLTALQSK